MVASPIVRAIASFHCFYKAFLFLHFIIEREIPQVQVIYDKLSFPWFGWARIWMAGQELRSLS